MEMLVGILHIAKGLWQALKQAVVGKKRNDDEAALKAKVENEKHQEGVKKENERTTDVANGIAKGAVILAGAGIGFAIGGPVGAVIGGGLATLVAGKLGPMIVNAARRFANFVKGLFGGGAPAKAATVAAGASAVKGASSALASESHLHTGAVFEPVQKSHLAEAHETFAEHHSAPTPRPEAIKRKAIDIVEERVADSKVAKIAKTAVEVHHVKLGTELIGKTAEWAIADGGNTDSSQEGQTTRLKA